MMTATSSRAKQTNMIFEVMPMKKIIIIAFIIAWIVSIILTVAILNSDLPDIWKWFLLK